LGETIITGERREVSDESLRYVIARLRVGDERTQDDFHVMRIIMRSEPDAPDEVLIDEYRGWEAEAEAFIADPQVQDRIQVVAEILNRRLSGVVTGSDVMAVLAEMGDVDLPVDTARLMELERSEEMAFLADLEEPERGEGRSADEDGPL
jgi:hypothetical protein